MKTIAEQLDIKEFPFIIKDSKGNQIYYESSTGYWIKNRFNPEGKEISYEDSDGSWYKREYGSNGNVIYYENSTGYWVKIELDSNGEEIYSADSYGNIRDNRKIPEFTMDELIEKIGNFKLKK